jgi:histidine triad (HIT) family protein
MPISDEQSEGIKKQILAQIESSFPEDKKEFAKEQLLSMNNEQLEEFVKQNKLVTEGEGGDTEGGAVNKTQCIFCSIVSGAAQSYKVGENEDAIAVLELNPVSKGHIIVLPKEHLDSEDKLSVKTLDLAEEMSKKIKKALNPKRVTVSSANVFGHELINVFPVYKDEDINSKRQQETPQNLSLMQESLTKEQEPVKIEKPKAEVLNEKDLWLPRRIP